MVVENKTKCQRETLFKALVVLISHVTQRPLLASALYLTLRQSKRGHCRVSPHCYKETQEIKSNNHFANMSALFLRLMGRKGGIRKKLSPAIPVHYVL